MIRGVLGAMLVGLAVWASPVAAQAPDASVGSQIRIVYGEPKNPAHQPIYERLQKRRVLEDFRDFLSPLKLPQPLTIKIEGCGVVNAYYSGGAVTICYEYIAWIHQIAAKVTLSNEISLEDAVVGPFVDVLLHEVAHAIFDLLKIPLFGREEDAADQLAAFILLQFGNDVARRTIVGAALLFRQMAVDQQPGTADYRGGARSAGAALRQRAVHRLRRATASCSRITSSRASCRRTGSAIAAGSTSRSRTPSRR